MTDRWKLLLEVPNEHRFFSSSFHPGEIVIADDSGETPDKTDDGILFLDIKKDIKENSEWQKLYELPLVFPNGETSSAIASRKEAELVARTFNMRICPDSEESEVELGHD